jgi:glycosyltransferase involved in cell wall biosynthesis
MVKKTDDGITVIVLSYERMTSLKLMLDSLLAQELVGIPIELIVCNNSFKVHLRQSCFSLIGRSLRKFSDIKIVNCSYSWGTSIRYALATLSKYDTILFVDDDMILRSHDFLAYMFREFKQLKHADLLSCWNRFWVEWNEDYYSSLSLTFKTPGIVDLTKCDVAGPGICMFNKAILTPRVLDVVTNPEFPGAFDMGFSLICALEHDSQCYYLPSYGMIETHEQNRKSALARYPEYRRDLHALFKSMWKQGYRPVLSRLSTLELRDSSEQKAIELLKPRKLSW